MPRTVSCNSRRSSSICSCRRCSNFASGASSPCITASVACYPRAIDTPPFPVEPNTRQPVANTRQPIAALARVPNHTTTGQPFPPTTRVFSSSAFCWPRKLRSRGVCRRGFASWSIRYFGTHYEGVIFDTGVVRLPRKQVAYGQVAVHRASFTQRYQVAFLKF